MQDYQFAYWKGRSLIYSETYHHHSWLLAWLHKQLACRLQAEDFAQDTFTRIITARDVPSIREPRAYLAPIAKGLLANHWRRSAIEQAYWQAIAAYPEQLAPDALLDQLPSKVRSAFSLGC